MLTSALCLVLAGQPAAADQVLLKIVAAHQKQTVGTVRIKRGALSTFVKFQKPNLLAIRTVPPIMRGYSAERIAVNQGNTVRVYEPFNNELYTTSVRSVSAFEARFGLTGTTKDEVVQMVVSPSKLADFFNTLRRYKGWSVKGNTLEAHGTGRPSPYNAKVNFDASYRLTGVDIVEGSYKYRFNIDWNAVSDFSIPANVRSVSAFSGPPEFPTGEAKAQGLIREMYRAYSRFTSGSLEAKTGNETYLIRFGKGSVSQSGPVTDWSWNGSQFTYSRTKGGPKKTMPADIRKARRAVGELKERVHPITVSLMNGLLPISSYLSADRVASYKGSISINGAECDLVRLTDKSSLVLTLFIRKGDKKLQAVDSETVDQRGARVSSIQTLFKYLN